MCGISGFTRSCSTRADIETLKLMGASLLHRGPDAGGEYLDEWVGLGHRRLSIIDLSSQGNQPMHSIDGRHIIVFNGEIYNYRELREELEKGGCSFRSRTDTEVILALYQREGVECLNRLNGMFAMALWDRDNKELLLARDRIGKKPLYYYHGGSDRLAFASEIKALLHLPGMTRTVEPTAVVDYLKYLYIPAPKTIFKNIYKLLPGHYLRLRVGADPSIKEYWNVKFPLYASSIEHDEAADILLGLIRSSTICRMSADVPLGAFLSGGIDSSAIVALMADASSSSIKTCSVGFMDKEHDEIIPARMVARQFQTDHAEYTVAGQVQETVQLLPKFFDEPFADSSAVPTFHVSQLARQNVTVALAGDGGDENFGGYRKYVTDLNEDLVRRLVPRVILKAVNGLAHQGGACGIMRKVRTLTSNALADPGHAYYQTNTFISDSMLEKLLSDRLRKVCRGYEPAEHTLAHWDSLKGADHLTRMLYTDIKTYLPGDILVKVDRMSMAHSLEVRAPLLDYRVVEFAASLPSRLKIRRGTQKLILKKAVSNHLPATIINRRKHGFTVPLDRWFRKELAPLVRERLLESDSLGEFFSLNSIDELWNEQKSQKSNHGTLLWSLLSFSLWQQEYLQV